MNTLPQWSSPNFINDGKPAFSPSPVMPDSVGDEVISKQPEHQTMNMNSIIRRSEEMFLIPNGLSDVVVFGTALLIIALFPFFSN